MNQAEVFDYAIVGSGIAALNLSWKLKKQNENIKIKVLDKARGCGGRLATRRVGDIKFDHGVQFLEKNMIPKDILEFWQKQNITKDINKKICAQSGITQLAKALVKDLDVSYEFKVTSLSEQSQIWTLTSETGDIIKARNVVITAPVPQALDILDQSNIKYSAEIKRIKYTKALVLLISSDQDFDTNLIYKENVNENILSICTQHTKHYLDKPAWTVIMSASWSENNFEAPDEVVLTEALKLIHIAWPKMSIKEALLKKWRYAFPEVKMTNLFEAPQRGLFLCGDGFGGADAGGAFKSSNGLYDAIGRDPGLLNRTRN